VRVVRVVVVLWPSSADEIAVTTGAAAEVEAAAVEVSAAAVVEVSAAAVVEVELVVTAAALVATAVSADAVEALPLPPPTA
jgi:phage gp45-like